MRRIEFTIQTQNNGGRKKQAGSRFLKAFGLVCLLLITNWFKISIHAAAIWALAGLMAGIFISFPGENLIYQVAVVFLIAGLVSSSRLYLGRHTQKEVWSGTFLGFSVGFLSVLLFG